MRQPSLKIGFVLDDSLDTSDGVQQYIRTLGTWLTANHYDVHYLVGQSRQQTDLQIHSLSKNVSVRFNGNRMSIPLPAKRVAIQNLLASQQFDVLHVQLPYSPLLAGRVISAADSSTAIFGTFHIAPYSKMVSLANRLLATALRPTLTRFDEIVSVSSAAADFARQCYGLRTPVLPNVVNLSKYESVRSLSEASKKIVFLGRLVPRKGCQVLLEAVNMLVKKQLFTGWQLVICGGGPLEASLKSYVREADLDRYVHFAGFIAEADKPAYLSSAELAVFPSSGGESFGIVLLEAMAAGHALVLAGDNAGYSSVLGDKPQLLFNPYSASQLAEKIAYFMTHAEDAQKLIRWQQQHRLQFDIETVGPKLVGYYNQALQRRRGMQ